MVDEGLGDRHWLAKACAIGYGLGVVVGGLVRSCRVDEFYGHCDAEVCLWLLNLAMGLINNSLRVVRGRFMRVQVMRG